MSATLFGSKIIEDLTDETINPVKIMLKSKVLKGAIKPIGRWRGEADIYSTGDHGNGYIFLYHEDEVKYFVRLRAIRQGGLQLGRQVLLWRKKEAEYITSTFAKYVFFTLLLPRYKLLAADTLQTRFGQNFWLNVMDSAFERDLFVYAYDRRSTPTRLIRLHSSEDAYRERTLLWGTDRGHEYTYPVISLVKLKEF